MQRLLLPAVATLLSPLALGQDTIAEDTAEIRRYTVEVIIFDYAEEVSVGTEVFYPDVPIVEEFRADPEEESGLDPLVELSFGDANDATAPAEPSADGELDAYVEEFILHFENEFTLGDIASRLERLDVYEPIMHFAWTQETRPEEETRAIDLESLGPAPEGLSGSFKLYLSRYLHLVVDLTFDEESALRYPVEIDDSVFSFSDARTGYAVEEEDPGVVRFRIQEDRIFKSGDLRYFDHPKFGVLATITRVEEEEPDVEPEMLGDEPGTLPGDVNQ
jgi:hypothetical protein